MTTSHRRREEEDDGDVTFPWSAGPTLDDALNASTRAAADEMLRAADISHEVASLFAARVARGVATSWEDARRGSLDDALNASTRAARSNRRDPSVSPRRGVRRGGGGVVDGVLPAEPSSGSLFAVADLLEKLPGVDPTDARIACVLAAVTVDAEELQRGAGHGRRQRRGNRAAGSFPRALAPAAGRGIGAMARRELAGAGGGGGEGARANGTGGRANGTGGRTGGATSGETRESRGGRRN